MVKRKHEEDSDNEASSQQQQQDPNNNSLTALSSPYYGITKRASFEVGSGMGNNNPLSSSTTTDGCTTASSSSSSITGLLQAHQSILLNQETSQLTSSRQNPETNIFAKNLKSLNGAFLQACVNTLSQNPSHSLVPLLKDYLHHTAQLMIQHRNVGHISDIVPLQKNGVTVADLNGNKTNSIIDCPTSFQSLGSFFQEFEDNYITQQSTNKQQKKKGSVDNQPLTCLFKNPLEFRTTTEISVNNAKKEKMPPSSSSTVAAAAAAIQQNSSINGKRIAGENPTATSSAPFLPFSLKSSSVLNDIKTPEKNVEQLENDPPPETTEEGTEEEEYIPPKACFIPVEEDEALYSKRCKLFAVIAGKAKNKGIGTLFVKKTNKGINQLLIRADNSLGTVMLNILLQAGLPLKQKDNTVLTSDMTGGSIMKDKNGNETEKKAAVPIIIKVKTDADAIELLTKLQEFQSTTIQK